VTNKSKYSPFGEGTPVGTTFGFTGQRYDAETGLYYYKNRHYSPAIGRFLQTDPIGYGIKLDDCGCGCSCSSSTSTTQASVNLYGYGGNDPLNQTDPLGLLSGAVVGAAVVAGVVGGLASGNPLIGAGITIVIISAAQGGSSPIQQYIIEPDYYGGESSCRASCDNQGEDLRKKEKAKCKKNGVVDMNQYKQQTQEIDRLIDQAVEECKARCKSFYTPHLFLFPPDPPTPTPAATTQ